MLISGGIVIASARGVCRSVGNRVFVGLDGACGGDCRRAGVVSDEYYPLLLILGPEKLFPLARTESERESSRQTGKDTAAADDSDGAVAAAAARTTTVVEEEGSRSHRLVAVCSTCSVLVQRRRRKFRRRRRR